MGVIGIATGFSKRVGFSDCGSCSLFSFGF
jgi:hypothetical protein